MSSTTRPDFSTVLNSGERLLWSGAPNREVMLSTMGKGKKPNYTFALAAVAFAAAFGWMNREQLSGFKLDELVGSFTITPLAYGLIPVVATIALIYRWNAGQAKRYVDSLAYAITDQRVLIMYRGTEIESYTPSQLQQAKIEERAGAEGYYDIVWGGRSLPRSSDGKAQTSPLNLERTRMGFKALRDGPMVMERIQSLLERGD
ncbi:MAG: hypothetical protein AAGG11_11815 [Pseudomonadota bacterium]